MISEVCEHTVVVPRPIREDLSCRRDCSFPVTCAFSTAAQHVSPQNFQQVQECSERDPLESFDWKGGGIRYCGERVSMQLVPQSPHELDGNSVYALQAIWRQGCATGALEQAWPTPPNARTASWAGSENRGLMLRTCDRCAQVPDSIDVTQRFDAGRTQDRKTVG